MIMLGSSHGLRVSDQVATRWHQVDLKQATTYIRRRERSTPGRIRSARPRSRRSWYTELAPDRFQKMTFWDD